MSPFTTFTWWTGICRRLASANRVIATPCQAEW